MFNRVMVRNVKGVEGDFQLGSTTVIKGPNESGKTAVMEAIRLAITGKAAIGGTGKKISELMSEASSSSIAIHPGGSSTWKARVGDSVSQTHNVDVDTQCGMPISVDEFWALSSAQKFSLLAGGAICDVAMRIDLVKEYIKATKAIVNMPAPMMPDVYSGAPRPELQKELDSVSLELRKHNEACVDGAKRQAALEKNQRDLDKYRDMIGGAQESLRLMKQTTAECGNKVNLLASLVERYNEASANEPKLIRWGRERGLELAPLIKHFTHELGVACAWASDMAERKGYALDAKNLRVAKADLDYITCETIMAIPRPAFERDDELWELVGASTPAATLSQANADFMAAKIDMNEQEGYVKDMQHSIHSLEQSLAAAVAIGGTPLLPEQLDALLTRKTELEDLLRKCDAWSNYDEENGRYVVKRSKASMELDELNDKLDKLNAERAAIVASITVPLESKANEILTRAGLPGLQIGITSTAKQASLDVRTSDDIALDALAGSRRLMYGMCLLCAMQQLSEAPCPVILACCAEMDSESFNKAVHAFGIAKRGNVILEHWAGVGTGGDDVVVVVNMEATVAA